MTHFESSTSIYVQEVANYTPLTREEEIVLFPRLKKGDITAKDRIIEGSLHIVFKIARSFSDVGLSYSDLIQEGNIGLIDALGKFDVKKGYRFSTYASFWVKQSIQTAVHRNCNLVRLPYRKVRMMGHITEAINNFIKLEGREPTIKELSYFLDVPMKTLSLILELREPILSLNQPFGMDERVLSDVIADQYQTDPRLTILRKQREGCVKSILSYLTPKERKVICWRYGLMNHPTLSLRKISKMIGMSQEGIRRIEFRALKKLQRPSLQDKVRGLI